MAKITLSYTRINNYHISHHSYLNYLLGAQIETTPAMTAGKATHERIQSHCLGKKIDPNIALGWRFTDAEYHTTRAYDDEFSLHGYIDLVDFRRKMLGEIKTGSPWSQKRFYDSMQWRFYGYLTGFRKAILITCPFDASKIKVYTFTITDEDIILTEKWIKDAVDGIRAGKFLDDLKDGKCDGRCPYGTACLYL